MADQDVEAGAGDAIKGIVSEGHILVRSDGSLSVQDFHINGISPDDLMAIVRARVLKAAELLAAGAGDRPRALLAKWRAEAVPPTNLYGDRDADRRRCVNRLADELDAALSAVPIADGEGQFDATALRKQLDEADEALGFGYFPSDGTGRTRAIREALASPPAQSEAIMADAIERHLQRCSGCSACSSLRRSIPASPPALKEHHADRQKDEHQGQSGLLAASGANWEGSEQDAGVDAGTSDETKIDARARTLRKSPLTRATLCLMLAEREMTDLASPPAAQRTDLERENAILRLAIPLEEEMSDRIDEMLKYLAMQQGYTLSGIARLLIDCQRRIVADWTEVGKLRHPSPPAANPPRHDRTNFLRLAEKIIRVAHSPRLDRETTIADLIIDFITPDPDLFAPAANPQEPQERYWERPENRPTGPLPSKYTHGLERTSPKGGPFLGRCRYCGTENLPMRAALEPCEAAPTQDEQVIDALALPAVRAGQQEPK